MGLLLVASVLSWIIYQDWMNSGPTTKESYMAPAITELAGDGTTFKIVVKTVAGNPLDITPTQAIAMKDRGINQLTTITATYEVTTDRRRDNSIIRQTRELKDWKLP